MLGEDNVIRIPHKVRTGKEAAELPVPEGDYSISSVSNSHEAATGKWLHGLFNHSNSDKIWRTLGVTSGYKQPEKPFQECFCISCATANSRSKGLRNTQYHMFSVACDNKISDSTMVESDSEDEEMPTLLTDSGDETSSSSDSDSDDGDPVWYTTKAEDSEESDFESEPTQGPMVDNAWEAAVRGRSHESKPPRFDIENLRPWEVMFADEKEFDSIQRGGYKTSFILLELKSDGWFFRKEFTKTQHGTSFRSIMVENGVQNLPYDRVVYTDGCGSMMHVKDMAINLGINHIYIPPHAQSLNEAERIADRLWASARIYLIDTGALDSHFAYAMDFSCYVKLRMATTAHRNWLTPYEILKGSQPSISHMQPFWTKAFVKVPKEKRSKMKEWGLANQRAETGNLIGYQDLWGTTPKVLLDRNRVVHNRNTIYDSQSMVNPKPPDNPQGGHGPSQEDIRVKDILDGFDSQDRWADSLRREGASNKKSAAASKQTYGIDPANKMEVHPNESLMGQGTPTSMVPHDDPNSPSTSINYDQGDAQGSPSTPPPNWEGDEIEWKGSPPWTTFGEATIGDPSDVDTTRSGRITNKPERGTDIIIYNIMYTPPVTPRDIFLDDLSRLQQLDQANEIFSARIAKASDALNAASQDGKDVMAHLIAAAEIAETAQKDMDWKCALSNIKHRDKAITALEEELASLEATILTKVNPTDADYEDAVKYACPGRLLLDIKRSLAYKVRGVKQGFREDLEQADGPGFNYYSSVVKLHAVRMTLLKRRARTRIMGIKDVSTAFLQSEPYPDGTVKYICFRDPRTNQWTYYRQSGPIYGEVSAPKRWEDTIAPWFEEMGFTRGQNERSCFFNADKDLLVLLYVDDCLADGDADDVKWIFDELEKKFKCKSPDMISDLTAQDYLGMVIKIDGDRIYMSMAKYIENACRILKIEGKSHVPINGPIDTDSPLLSPQGKTDFLTAVGMLGWLAQTVRFDVAYAYSRIAQHSASPSESAMKAVRTAFAYLQQSKHHCISAQIYEDDMDIQSVLNRNAKDTEEWSFHVDSDHAGNAEIQNKRRSQNGLMAKINNAPFMWQSKATSVTFASERIGEAHADMSSGSVEIYAAGNATLDIMAISYAAEEMGMNFPFPFTLEMDNDAAKIFCQGTAHKTKLKHIDCRQEWVQTLRDRGLMTPVHIDTKLNDADIFTKILDRATFEMVRDRCMVEYNCHQDA